MRRQPYRHGNTVCHRYGIARMRPVQPSGWRACALFFPSSLSPFVLPSFSLFCPISLSISSLTALCRSSAFDSVPVSKLLVLSTISPFTTPFPPFATFRSRISASLLNNCPLREELKGYALRRIKESKDREMHHRRRGSLFYKYIGRLFNINICL